MEDVLVPALIKHRVVFLATTGAFFSEFDDVAVLANEGEHAGAASCIKQNTSILQFLLKRRNLNCRFVYNHLQTMVS